MNVLEFVTGFVLALLTLAVVLTSPFMLIHARTQHDHGPDCWWCHPRLRRR